MSEIPVYKFALRQDLANDLRFLPTKADPLATGWDVRSADIVTITPYQHARIHLGFRGFCPEGWWYELRPRSSTFAKKKLHSLYGTIDETYEGELIFACQYIPNSVANPAYLKQKVRYYTFGGSLYYEEGDHELKIEFGDAIGQIVPVKRQEMIAESISNEEFDRLCQERKGARGAGGFGSTGR